MRGYNAALVAYNAIDLDNFKMDAEEKPSTGLLAPRKQMTKTTDISKQPAMRAIEHMKALRKRRDQINGSR